MTVAFPFGIAELTGVGLGDSFADISAATGEGISPCTGTNAASFAVGGDWLLAATGDGTSLINEGAYVKQPSTALTLMPTVPTSGPIGPRGPYGVRLGDTEQVASDALAGSPPLFATYVRGGATIAVTLYSETLDDGSTLTLELTDGVVTRITVADKAPRGNSYAPPC